MSLEGVPKLGFSFADKLAHALVYFVFTILWFLAFSKGITNTILKNNAIVASAIFAIIYGICVEIMQETLVTNRQGDWQDVLANTTGTILAIFLIKWFIANNRKLKTQN
ncbi:hypothetical protein KAOT1_19747 [Kordia algicida OT-1]|uniref:VanZ-like domain-containing protein n=2 Tax=Kordia TaxID=221065 RepID=A9DPG5_9FLAO|nr:hypothetical protein KAOT1_19747 [Kordia algicida OT-1]